MVLTKTPGAEKVSVKKSRNPLLIGSMVLTQAEVPLVYP